MAHLALDLGNGQAWDALEPLLRPRNLHVIRRIVPEADLTASLWQDVLLKLLRDFPRARRVQRDFPTYASLEGFIATCSTHRALDWRRKRRRWVDVEGPPEVQAPETDEEEHRRQAMLAAVVDWIDEAELEEVERWVLEMRCFMGYTPAQIAAERPDAFSDGVQDVYRIIERLTKRMRRALKGTI